MNCVILLYCACCIVLIHVKHYIHGSSQGQFIVETYIVIFLRILFCYYLVAVLITYIITYSPKSKEVHNPEHTTFRVKLLCIC